MVSTRAHLDDASFDDANDPFPSRSTPDLGIRDPRETISENDTMLYHDFDPAGGESSANMNNIRREDVHMHSLQETPTSQPSEDSFWDRFWILELICCIASVLGVVAVVAILRVYNDHPRPDWPSYVSINAVVSILSVILRATMITVIAQGISQTKWLWFQTPHPLSEMDMFDSASRGPFGSMKLLVALRLRHLAALGAAITLLLAGIGPFIQQSITYYSCLQVETNSTVSVSRTQVYSGLDTNSFAGFAELNLPLVSAIYEGILSPANNETEVSFDCPSGNCQYSIPYTTGGVCSSCSNAVYYLNNTCTNFTASDGYTCTSSLPNGLSISNSGDGILQSVPIMAATSAGSLLHEASVDSVGSVFSKFSMISVTNASCTTEWVNNTQDRKPDTDCVPDFITGHYWNVTAVECSLSLCAYTHTASVMNGILSEQLISVSGSNSFIQKELMSVLSNPCYLNGEVLHFENINGGQSLFFPNITTYAASYFGWAIVAGKNITIPQECVYSFSTLALVQFFLGETYGVESTPFFNGTITTAEQSWRPGQLTYNPRWMEPLYNNNTANLASVSESFAQLANVMTTEMRKNGPNQYHSNPSAPGISYINETCVGVNWFWLSFPIILVGLSCLFLVLVVVQTNRSRARLWKSSPLPLLFNGLERGTRDRLGPSGRLAGMRECSNVQVVLRPVNGEWRLVDGMQRTETLRGVYYEAPKAGKSTNRLLQGSRFESIANHRL